MGFIKPNNNSGGSGGGLTPQELSRLNNAYTHSKSEHAPTTAEQNVQPDWNETDTTSDAYIKNKPDLSQIGSGGGIPSVTQVEPQELDMPKVFFYGTALPATKDNVNLTMDYISSTAKFSSYIKLKCQGTSSMSYAKKNFTINMYSDEAREIKLKKDFKGWGAQSKFCLKANYVDTTHTRNISGARIAYDMVASRPDSAFKQQLLQCPRNGLVDGFPIKLYFNGEFYGIYTWNIPKDTWMFNMDKNNLNHIVLCAERNTDGNSSAINSCQFRQLWTNGDGQDWSVEVGTMSEDLRTKFNRVIAFVMNSTDQEFHDNIGEYFDLYSLLDYYCFSYFVNHLDGLAKNMLMVTYDGVIWGASLYDMDSIYGVSWNGGSFVSPQYQCPEQYQEQFSRLWVRIEQCFATELYARYLELRQGALSLSNIIKHVEEIYDVIPDRVFADEKAKWTSLPNVNTNTMTRFRNYMRDRAVYVDAQMQEIGTPQSSVECTGISLDKTELTLGVVEGGGTDDSNKNYLDGVEWKDGQLNGSGQPINGTDKYAEINVTLPGKYTFSTTNNYSYLKIYAICENDIAYGTNVNLTEQTINVFEPCTIRCSAYPNSLEWDSSSMSITRQDFSSFSSKDVNYELIESDINVRYSNSGYTFAEVYLDKLYEIATISFNNNSYKCACKKSLNANENAINDINSLLTKNLVFVGEYNNKTYLNITLPASMGTSASEILANMTSTTITINSTDELAKLETPATSEILSAELTATVTPSNCTQPVVWSVSPEGIVTVNNGLVTAVTNGEATVTATCGTQSANCAVTVSGMSESGGDTEIYTTAEYAITEARTFNGTSDYIDTGIQLFDTAKDFAVYIDYTPTTGVTQSNQAVVFHCLHEVSPYRGLTLMIKSGTTQPYMIGGQGSGNTSYLDGIGDGNHKYLIQFTNGTISSIKTIGDSNNIVNCTLGTTASANPYVQVTENLLLGCFQTVDGAKGRFWTGTINKFGVWFKQLTENEINQVFGKSGGDTEPTNSNLVFQVNSASMNTADNTLTDNIAGISATLTGNPTVSGNQIAFTANDKFNFDISSLNLTNSNRTLRIKFTPTTLNSRTKNVFLFGALETAWSSATSIYVTDAKLIMQHPDKNFSNCTVGATLGSSAENRLPGIPTTNTEYEIVISENVTTKQVRWFINGDLVQDGTTTFYNPLCLSNTEGNNRFIGSYSLIEIYNGYCNDYTEFTNMVNSRNA